MVLALPTVKFCRRCEQWKPLTEWWRNCRSRDGLQAYCKPCHGSFSLQHRDPKRHFRLNKNSRLKRQFGITLAQFEEMAANGCQACGRMDKLCVDHDHATGKVRGALCDKCNRAVGLLDDSGERALAIARYLGA